MIGRRSRVGAKPGGMAMEYRIEGLFEGRRIKPKVVEGDSVEALRADYEARGVTDLVITPLAPEAPVPPPLPLFPRRPPLRPLPRRRPGRPSAPPAPARRRSPPRAAICNARSGAGRSRGSASIGAGTAAPPAPSGTGNSSRWPGSAWIGSLPTTAARSTPAARPGTRSSPRRASAPRRPPRARLPPSGWNSRSRRSRASWS